MITIWRPLPRLSTIFERWVVRLLSYIWLISWPIKSRLGFRLIYKKNPTYICSLFMLFSIKRQLKFHSPRRERGKTVPAATWKEPRGQLIDAAQAACPASADMLDKLAHNYRWLLPAGPSPTNISMRNWRQSLQNGSPSARRQQPWPHRATVLQRFKVYTMQVSTECKWVNFKSLVASALDRKKRAK